MGAALLIIALLALLGGAGWVGYAGWNLHPEYTMPPVGYAMMAAGIVLSLLVGCGLMALVFYSSRRGYDEPAQQLDLPPNPPDASGPARTTGVERRPFP